MKKIIAISIISAFSLFSCNDSKTSITSHTEKDNSEVQIETGALQNSSGDDIVLTMGIMVDHPFYCKGRDLVKEFNDKDNGYKIVLKDYAEGFDPTANIGQSTDGILDWDRELTLDIMNGEVLDIIPNTFINQGRFHILAEKGAFTNLYSFMDNDDLITKGELFENVLQACEINNELRYMPLSFSIDTLSGDKKYVGTKTSWTFDEMKEYWEKAPEGSTIGGHRTKDDVYYTLLRGILSSFIDYDKAECHFDSDEFINILDFLNSFDDYTGNKAEIDFMSPSFLINCRIEGFKAFHSLFYSNSIDDINFIGYPSNDKCGSYFGGPLNQVAICASSSAEKQKGAWEFIRMLISYDCQYNNGFSKDINIESEYAFPINKKAFEDMGRDFYSQENEVSDASFSSNETENRYLTKKEYDRLVDIINNTHKINTDMEDDIFEIINDEIFSMFRNEKSSQQIASNIQNRVQILISERI